MCLFIQLIQLIHRKIFKEIQDMKGVTIGGIKLNNLRYAEDTALLCFCPTELQELLNVVNKAGKTYGMEMNIIKTKAMVISKTTLTPKINITLEGKHVQQRYIMIYLGSLKTKDGQCEKEIKRRKELARSAFEKMSKVTTSRTINIKTRKRASQCYIWSMLLYGSEKMDIDKGNSKQT